MPALSCRSAAGRPSGRAALRPRSSAPARVHDAPGAPGAPSVVPLATIATVALALSTALALAPASAAAQERPAPPWERRSTPTVAIAGGALYSGARTGGAARLGDGVGFDVQASIGISAFALGVGYQRTQHALPGAGSGDATDAGVFVEPRLSLAPFRNFTPYVAGRVGFLRREVPASARFVAGRTNLTQLGAGLGTLVSVAPNVQLDLGAMWSDVRARGDDDATRLPVPQPFVGGTGSGVLLRAGVVFGFDRWGR